jgi:hypothetical protein
MEITESLLVHLKHYDGKSNKSSFLDNHDVDDEIGGGDGDDYDDDDDECSP